MPMSTSDYQDLRPEYTLEDLNETYPLYTEPVEGFWNTINSIIITHPLLSFLFMCSIIYIIYYDIKRQRDKDKK
jgi:hypothetical protein